MKCQNKIKSAKVFQLLTDQQAKLLEDNTVEINYKKGELILKEGALIPRLFYLESGYVKMYKEDSDNHLLIYDILSCGRFFDLTTIYQNDISSYSVSAISECKIMSIDITIFREVLNNNAEFARAINQLFVKFIKFLNVKIFSMATKQLNGRIADLFIYLGNEVYLGNCNKILLSRKELADLSGMSKMSITKGINQLLKEKVIRENNNKIEIIDYNKLQEISKYG